MPKGQKSPTTAKSVYIKFTTDEDLALYDQLEHEANQDRRKLGDYLLIRLLSQYATDEQSPAMVGGAK